jgi:RNA polymerase sigma-70 factor (ECF subfamily)
MNRTGPPPDAGPARGPDGPAFLARLRAREDAAFEELVRAYSGRLLATAARILGNDEDARDATQDAFLSAFRSIDRFEGESLASTWLHRIVINASLMKLRSRRRKPEGRIEDLLPRFLEDGHFENPPVEWKEPSDLLIHRRQTRQIVRECIDRLPETYRTVLLLRDIEELDTEETSKLLGVSTNAVKTRLHRARQALRTLLDPHLRESAP